MWRSFRAGSRVRGSFRRLAENKRAAGVAEIGRLRLVEKVRRRCEEEEEKEKEKEEADDASDEHRKLADLKSDQTLPRLQELPLPTVAELHRSPVDWILLKGLNKQNELVVVVKQVFPRPDTLQKLQAAIDALRRQPMPATQEGRDKRQAQRNELSKLVVLLPDDQSGQLYEIPTNVIDSIIYHEDLIIRRATVLIDQGRFRDAFELLCPLARRALDWKGLKEQTQRLVYLEAKRASKPAISNQPLPRWRSCIFRTAIIRSCRNAWAKRSTS